MKLNLILYWDLLEKIIIFTNIYLGIYKFYSKKEFQHLFLGKHNFDIYQPFRPNYGRFFLRVVNISLINGKSIYFRHQKSK